jgi:hypothetical protein
MSYYGYDFGYTWNSFYWDPLTIICFIPFVLCLCCLIGLTIRCIWKSLLMVSEGTVSDKKKVMLQKNDIYYGYKLTVTIDGMSRGKEKKSTYNVSQEQFDQIQIGSYININAL